MSDEHIKPLRLFNVAEDTDFKLTEEEKKHLGNCEECAYVVVVFARVFSREKRARDKGQAA